jgi:hypothetical protein
MLTVVCGWAGAIVGLAMMVLTAEEVAKLLRDSDVVSAFWLGDDGGDALDEETDERILLLDAMFAWLCVVKWEVFQCFGYRGC